MNIDVFLPNISSNSNMLKSHLSIFDICSYILAIIDGETKRDKSVLLLLFEELKLGIVLSIEYFFKDFFTNIKSFSFLSESSTWEYFAKKPLPSFPIFFKSLSISYKFSSDIIAIINSIFSFNFL
jgi:hypothetical protein